MAGGGLTSQTICWNCANAVPNEDGTRGCNWSRNKMPVNGWEAELKLLRLNPRTVTDSYVVKKCPEFVEG